MKKILASLALLLLSGIGAAAQIPQESTVTIVINGEHYIFSTFNDTLEDTSSLCLYYSDENHAQHYAQINFEDPERGTVELSMLSDGNIVHLGRCSLEGNVIFDGFGDSYKEI